MRYRTIVEIIVEIDGFAPSEFYYLFGNFPSNFNVQRVVAVGKTVVIVKRNRRAYRISFCLCAARISFVEFDFLYSVRELAFVRQ